MAKTPIPIKPSKPSTPGRVTPTRPTTKPAPKAKVPNARPSSTPPSKASSKSSSGGGGKQTSAATSAAAAEKRALANQKAAEKRALAAQKAAEKRAIAREKATKAKTGKRYLESAANLEFQAKAIKDALKIEFARSRDQNLTDIDKVLGEQLQILQEGSRQRGAQFLQQAEDSEIATAGTAESGISNLVRERADSLNAVLEHGAGETDSVRAMLMSARNWHANAQESNRSYFDTMSGVNNSIVDLNIDTQSALANASNQAESERERIWQDYYNRRSEAYTQLGNIKGQQADYYAQAKEMGVKPKKGAETSAEKAMQDAFQASADEAGKSYKNKGLPQWIQEYQGTQQVQARQSNTNLAAAIALEPVKKAEGATLRKWAA